MTSSTPNRETGGYRGALPPRNDRLARPWVVTVILIFVLILAVGYVYVWKRGALEWD